MRTIPLIRCLPKMSPSSSTSTSSQIATWRRSLTWTRREFSFDLQCWRERYSSDCRRFSLNPVQRNILPHRRSQLSDLTIRLRLTTSLKSISQIRWLYHQLFKNWCYRHAVQLNVNQSMSRDQSFFVLIGPIAFSWYPVMINHKYVNIQTSVVGPQ